MMLSDEARFFSAGATTGGFIAALMCFVFPSITLYVMLFYGVLAGTSLYKLKDEFDKFL